MFSINNQAIDILAYDKNGKLSNKITLKNRLLDNYLDYIIFNMLPTDIGYSVFPKFDPIDTKIFPLSQCYIKFDTPQTIVDSSTKMDYETILRLIIYDNPYGVNRTVSEVVGETKKTIQADYLWYAGNIDPPLTNSIFQGLGFGRDNNFTQDSDNWLLAYLDIGLAGIVFNSDFSYRFIRYDEISTNEKLLSGPAMLHLPGAKSTGKLHSVIMCASENGNLPIKEYAVDAITFTYVSTGKVSITGFDNYYIESSILHPSGSLYPATNQYPSQDGSKIKSVRFKYDTQILYGDPIYNYVKGETIETYINIDDLDVSYHNKAMSINLICERGDY